VIILGQLLLDERHRRRAQPIRAGQLAAAQALDTMPSGSSVALILASDIANPSSLSRA